MLCSGDLTTISSTTPHELLAVGRLPILRGCHTFFTFDVTATGTDALLDKVSDGFIWACRHVGPLGYSVRAILISQNYWMPEKDPIRADNGAAVPDVQPI